VPRRRGQRHRDRRRFEAASGVAAASVRFCNDQFLQNLQILQNLQKKLQRLRPFFKGFSSLHTYVQEKSTPSWRLGIKSANAQSFCLALL
jgi:hypothetical protein